MALPVRPPDRDPDPLPPRRPGIPATREVLPPVYGEILPTVFGTDKVKAQVVYASAPTFAGGLMWIEGAWKQAGALAVDALYAVCEASASSIRRIFRSDGYAPPTGIAWADRNTYCVKNAPSAGDVSSVLTAAAATAWSKYVGTDYEGMGHAGTVQIRCTGVLIPVTGTRAPEITVEVSGANVDAGSPTGLDVSPADAVVELFTTTRRGLGLSAALVDVENGIDGTAASSFRRFCSQQGLWVSRTLDGEDDALDLIQSLLDICDAMLVDKDGVFVVVPLADRAVGTFTPYTTPHTIGDADFALEDGEHLSLERLDADRVSVFPVEYRTRKTTTGEYQETFVEGFDEATVSEIGSRRDSPFTTDWVISDSHAQWLADTLAVRARKVRSKWTLRLKPKWAAKVVPGDFLSVSESKFGISGRSMRVVRLRYSLDGAFEVEALDWEAVKVAVVARQSPLGLHSTNVRRTPTADYGLANVLPGVVDLAKLTSSTYDKDNLWPNPSSEIAPPVGADETAPEWANRYDAGAGAYSGSWVRRLSGESLGFWIPCSPGAQFYVEAQAKRESGSGAGLRLNIGFYPTLGSFSGGSVTNGASSTSGSWAKVACLSAVAAAGMNAAFISCEAQGSDVGQFDSLYARRVAEPEAVASVDVTLNGSTYWSVTGSPLKKTGGIVQGTTIFAALSGVTTFLGIGSVPSDSLPLTTGYFFGTFYDASALLYYACRVTVATNGNINVDRYSDGSANGLVAMIAPGQGDTITVYFGWAWK